MVISGAVNSLLNWFIEHKTTGPVASQWTMVFNPYSAGIDFSHQNLTSADVRSWRLKVYPRTVRMKIFLMAVDT